MKEMIIASIDTGEGRADIRIYQDADGWRIAVGSDIDPEVFESESEARAAVAQKWAGMDWDLQWEI